MPEKLLLIYIGGALLGLLLETLLFKLHYLVTKKHYKEHHYKFSRYVSLLVFPMLLVLLVIFKTDATTLYVFFSSALFGTLLEWLIGWSYYNIMGQRLWTYHRYTISKYTSLLSIPLWGFFGVVFWTVAKFIDK
jgi:uncharacterized membrane protein